VDLAVRVNNKIMNREALYNKTVDILYQSYLNDTLRHNDCAACAVGNIIAANLGFKVIHLNWLRDDNEKADVCWQRVFYTDNKEQIYNPYGYGGLAKEQIDASGYKLSELMKIEYAFETADKGESKDDWMFNGLVAVIDVLDKIHEVEKNTTKKQFKELYLVKVENY